MPCRGLCDGLSNTPGTPLHLSAESVQQEVSKQGWEDSKDPHHTGKGCLCGYDQESASTTTNDTQTLLPRGHHSQTLCTIHPKTSHSCCLNTDDTSSAMFTLNPVHCFRIVHDMQVHSLDTTTCHCVYLCAFVTNTSLHPWGRIVRRLSLGGEQQTKLWYCLLLLRMSCDRYCITVIGC